MGTPWILDALRRHGRLTRQGTCAECGRRPRPGRVVCPIAETALGVAVITHLLDDSGLCQICRIRPCQVRNAAAKLQVVVGMNAATTQLPVRRGFRD